MNIGQRFRELREARGLTQQAVADRIGRSRNEIARLESPASNPTMGTLLECCWAIEVTLPQFFQSQIPSEIVHPEHRELHEQLQAIIDAGGDYLLGIKLNLRAIWALVVAQHALSATHDKAPGDGEKTKGVPHPRGRKQ